MMKNILVVDDSKEIADMIKITLELSEYKCTATYEGQDCLQLLSQNNFDLILLDIAMPDITGIDILRKVKSDPKLSKNKIIFITASSPSSEAIANLVRDGALQVVQKPINKRTLLNLVAKYA